MIYISVTSSQSSGLFDIILSKGLNGAYFRLEGEHFNSFRDAENRAIEIANDFGVKYVA